MQRALFAIIFLLFSATLALTEVKAQDSFEPEAATATAPAALPPPQLQGAT